MVKFYHCNFVSFGASSGKKLYCVTEIKPGTVAVSSPELKKKKLYLVNTEEPFKCTSAVDTKYEPKAIQGLENDE